MSLAKLPSTPLDSVSRHAIYYAMCRPQGGVGGWRNLMMPPVLRVEAYTQK